jgi:hypothetical protein
LRDFASGRAARVVLLFLLGSLPAFFLFQDIRRTAVNVPFMDDWQFIPLLEKASRAPKACHRNAVAYCSAYFATPVVHQVLERRDNTISVGKAGPGLLIKPRSSS